MKFVDETYEECDAVGNLVSPEDYLIKVREEILTACHSMVELQNAWIERNRRASQGGGFRRKRTPSKYAQSKRGDRYGLKIIERLTKEWRWRQRRVSPLTIYTALKHD